MSRVPTLGGVLAVDKPVGPTSHDVVARARRALGDRRIGHTGTLDPFASGVLLLCCGPATRLSQFMVGSDKTYHATVLFGSETDTLDPEGTVVAADDAWRELTSTAIEEACRGMEGDRMQTPPAFSAKKIQGEAAHRRARRGEEVELKPVPVTIRELRPVEIDLPRVVLDTTVSSGTYVRAIARDLGRALGTRAHLTDLRRTRVGMVDLSRAVDLERLDQGGALPWIMPLEAVGHLPRIVVDSDEARRLAHGQRIELAGSGDVTPEAETDHDAETGSRDGLVRIAVSGELLGIGERMEGAVLRPRKIFLSPDEIEG